MDYGMRYKIESAIQAAVDKMNSEAEECVACLDTRERFPGVIHLFQGEGGTVEAKIATPEDVKGKVWMELRAPGEYAKVVICQRCAIKRKLMVDPDRCIPCEEEVGGVGRCLKHNPLPVPVPVAVAAPPPSTEPQPF